MTLNFKSILDNNRLDQDIDESLSEDIEFEYAELLDKHDKLIDKYNALVKKYNKVIKPNNDFIFSGRSSIFGPALKGQIICGCGCTFDVKSPYSDFVSAICPNCGIKCQTEVVNIDQKS